MFVFIFLGFVLEGTLRDLVLRFSLNFLGGGEGGAWHEEDVTSCDTSRPFLGGHALREWFERVLSLPPSPRSLRVQRLFGAAFLPSVFVAWVVCAVAGAQRV